MFGRKKNYKTVSDEKLMTMISYGDHSAFTEIYERYSSRMQYYFYRMLGNSNEIAEDFLQELFTKIISKPNLFDSSKKFKTWMFSIAHNMCKNEYRRIDIRKSVNPQDINNILSLENTTNTTEKENLIGSIFEELSYFDDTHRSVFIFHYREGLSVKEISEILSISTGTVKSRLFTCRKRLADKFKDQYEEITIS